MELTKNGAFWGLLAKQLNNRVDIRPVDDESVFSSLQQSRCRQMQREKFYRVVYLVVLYNFVDIAHPNKDVNTEIS